LVPNAARSDSASWRLADLVDRLGGVVNPPDAGSDWVRRVSSIESATRDSLCFLASPKFRASLARSGAGFVVLRTEDCDAVPAGMVTVTVANPYLWFARAAALFSPPPPLTPGVHPHASVDPTASLGPGCQVDAGAVIAAGAQVGSNTRVGAGVYLGQSVEVGSQVCLHPRVTIYGGCKLGDRVIVHSGAVIGADGFGFARDGTQWVKIPQTGRVLIGDDCEIGANTTIDRGALDDTIIERGCKLDNQIQIAHNVRLGEGCALAACVGIAGSAVLGAHCQVGGGAGILGHLEIAAGTVISAMSLVTRSIPDSGFYTGVFPLMANRDWEHAAARLRRDARLRRRPTAATTAITTANTANTATTILKPDPSAHASD